MIINNEDKLLEVIEKIEKKYLEKGRLEVVIKRKPKSDTNC